MYGILELSISWLFTLQDRPDLIVCLDGYLLVELFDSEFDFFLGQFLVPLNLDLAELACTIMFCARN